MGLKIIKFDVPLARANGSSAVLHCDYDLESSELYSVKFYKDYVEFYRYLPNDHPPAQAFKLDGIHLNVMMILFSSKLSCSTNYYRFLLLAVVVVFVVLLLPPVPSPVRKQLEKSNATHVVLYETDLASDGLYACEISTEGPAFATRKNEKMMKIYGNLCDNNLCRHFLKFWLL